MDIFKDLEVNHFFLFFYSYIHLLNNRNLHCIEPKDLNTGLDLTNYRILPFTHNPHFLYTSELSSFFIIH
jgi:hypothetical protein